MSAKRRRSLGMSCIPMIEAFSIQGRCPLCRLDECDEERKIQNYLREFVMDPAYRVIVEDVGICSTHASLMLDAGDILGAAISVRALMQGRQGEPQLGAEFRELGGVKSQLRRIFRLRLPEAQIDRAGEQCVFCRELEAEALRRACDVVDFFSVDQGFQRLFSTNEWLCLPHSRQLYQLAGKRLRDEQCQAMQSVISDAVNRNLARVRAKLDWFITKHDYRNSDCAWNGCENAPKEAARFVLGRHGAFERGTG